MLKKEVLTSLYVEKSKSVHEIALDLGCSNNKVTYWLQKYNIPRRSISEAIYMKSNPDGDPFSFQKPVSKEDWFLYGLGLGLFWGEGNKVNKHTVRLGNTDPQLISVFLDFLDHMFRIDKAKLKFGLQVFSDIDPETTKKFWKQKLDICDSQFQKVVVTPSTKKGTYKRRNEYGVLTIYFSNIKLRDSIVSAIEALQTDSYAIVAQSVERIHGKS